MTEHTISLNSAHTSRIENGMGCLRVDIGNGMSMSNEKIRVVFTDSSNPEKTKVEVYEYWTCKDEREESNKLNEEYVETSFLDLTYGKAEKVAHKQFQELKDKGVIEEIEEREQERGEGY